MYRIVPSLSLWIKFCSVTTECYWAVKFWFYCVKNFLNKVIIILLLCYSRKYPYFPADDFFAFPHPIPGNSSFNLYLCWKNWDFKNHMPEFFSLLDLIIIKNLFFISMEKIIWCYHSNETSMKTICMLLFTFCEFLVFLVFFCYYWESKCVTFFFDSQWLNLFT